MSRKKALWLGGLIMGSVLATGAWAKPLQFCLFDPSGKDGDLYALASDYLKQAEMPASGVEFKAYRDERIAVEDFKSGICDGVAVSTMRARQFNPFVGSIDAFGALSTPEQVRGLLSVLAKPQLNASMVQGKYEVAGVISLGALYVLVKDRSMNAVEKMAGRRVAVLDWDQSQAKLVQNLAAQPVATDVTRYASKFNNGQVDVIAAPALLFKSFELERGLGSKGAVYRFPLAQLTGTILIRQDRFPAGFAATLRSKAPAYLDASLARVARAEANLPGRYWLTLGEKEGEHYQQMLDAAREQLVEDGYYDPRMMALLRHVRCQQAPARAECSLALN